VDAEAGAVAQDAKIAGLIHDAGKGVVVVFNKWDLVPEKGANTHLDHWQKFCESVPFLTYAPWFTLSALTRQRTGKILETVWDVHEQRNKRIPTAKLNEVLERVIAYQAPRSHGGGVGKIYFGTPIEQAPPTFLLSVNEPRCSSPSPWVRCPSASSSGSASGASTCVSTGAATWAPPTSSGPWGRAGGASASSWTWPRARRRCC
jgi:predicted GTPase